VALPVGLTFASDGEVHPVGRSAGAATAWAPLPSAARRCQPFTAGEPARRGHERVVWASSETVLGLPFRREQPAYAPIDEEHPLYPESSYACRTGGPTTLPTEAKR
jgi:hypothetical protein